MSRRHSDYLVFAKILGLFETAERAWVMAFGERVFLFSFGVVINLLWVMGGWGSVVVSTSDSGTASECWRVSRNLALGFFAVTVTVWVWLELEVGWVGWPLAFETLVCFIFFLDSGEWIKVLTACGRHVAIEWVLFLGSIAFLWRNNSSSLFEVL